MENLIERGKKSIDDEKTLINRMLEAEEYNDNDVFMMLSSIYKETKSNTDLLVDELLDNYSFEDITTNIRERASEDNEDSLGYLTLYDIIDSKYVYNYSKEKYALNSDCFIEEHNRYLYLLYLWYVQNNKLSEDLKKSLHKFMVLRLCNSQFVRRYYSGEIESAKSYSNPDANLGIMTNEFSQRNYYSYLNKFINDANCCEIYEGSFEEYVVDAKRTVIELELAALSLQMNNRGIVFPVSESPITDYSRTFLEHAAVIFDKYNAGNKRRSYTFN